MRTLRWSVVLRSAVLERGVWGLVGGLMSGIRVVIQVAIETIVTAKVIVIGNYRDR